MVWVVALLAPMLSAAAGFYFGGYLSKKGEGLATREDLGKLVEQVRAVNTATKEIETSISNETWERRRQWELRRSILLEGAKGVGACFEALLEICWAYRSDKEPLLKGQAGNIDRRTKAAEEFARASQEFVTSTCFLVSLLGDKDLQQVLEQFGKLTRRIGIEVSGGNFEATVEHRKEYEFLLSALGGLFEEALKASV